MEQWAGFGRIVLTNLAVLVGGFVLCEVIFGGWFRFDPLVALGIPRSVEIEYDVTVPGGDRWHSVYRRDSWGLRGTFSRIDDIGILTIGGSTTDQRLLSEEDTWQAALGRELELRGIRSGIGNAGVDGQSTVGHLRTLDVWLPAIPGLRPRTVLVYAGINDVALGDGIALVDALAPPQDFRRWIVDRSALYRLWRIIRGVVRAERYSLTHSVSAEPPEDWHVAFEDPLTDLGGLDAYGDRLRRIAGRIREWGADPIFITQPLRDMRSENGVVLVRGSGGIPRIHAFNKVTLAVCRELSLRCFDLAGELRFERGDYYDALHYTPQGARRIGRWLGQRL